MAMVPSYYESQNPHPAAKDAARMGHPAGAKALFSQVAPYAALKRRSSTVAQAVVGGRRGSSRWTQEAGSLRLRSGQALTGLGSE
jgi:hypothetical protein